MKDVEVEVLTERDLDSQIQDLECKLMELKKVRRQTRQSAIEHLIDTLRDMRGDGLDVLSYSATLSSGGDVQIVAPSAPKEVS